MIEKVTTTPPDITAHENAAAPDVSIAMSVWKKAETAEKQLQLMRKLQKLKLGTAEVENFLENLEGSKKIKTKT